MLNKAVFLDRDGVLNKTDIRNGKPYAPTRLEDFIILPGIPEAIRRLKQEKYLLVVVTNQPDVGNGKVKKDIVEMMHQKLKACLPVDQIRACYHSQTDGCLCRKPGPGMLLDAAEELSIDLHASIMIGDRCSDIEAGKAAGCKTIFIDRNYKEDRPVQPDIIVSSLVEAVDKLLGKSSILKAGGAGNEQA